MEGLPMTIYGYARVSTDGQTLDAQHAKLTAEGAQKIFSEKESGAKIDRKALAKALAALEPGDMFIVRG
jgi:DNA invertase Pin-like site-specific DNA recombinase